MPPEVVWINHLYQDAHHSWCGAWVPNLLDPEPVHPDARVCGACTDSMRAAQEVQRGGS